MIDFSWFNLALASWLVLSLWLIGQRIKLKASKNRLYNERSHLEKQITSHHHALERLTKEIDSLMVQNKSLKKEQTQSKNELQAKNQQLDALMDYIDSIDSILIATLPWGSITLWNKDAEKATHIPREDAIGKSIDEVYPDLPVTIQMIQEVVSTQEKKVMENMVFQDNQVFIDLTIYPLVSEQLDGVLIRVDDVTFRVQLENMIIQNDKMRSLGELSTGMAHELNNPLSVVINSAQNTLRRLAVKSTADRKLAEKLDLDIDTFQAYLQGREILVFINNILEAGNRAANIAKSMLEYARTGGQHVLVDLNALVKRSLELVFNSLTSADRGVVDKFSIEFDLQPDLPMIECSGTEIQQVVINLVNNGLQALKSSIPENTTPTLTLKTYQHENCARIEVIDNGPGMTESVANKIFEPFFTTKKTGEGTGLGLSVSFYITNIKHKGSLQVFSTPGQGARFVMQLPLKDLP